MNSQPRLFTTAEMEREWAIQDTLEAYQEEITWETQNGKSCKLFSLKDPSRIHEKNANLRRFHAMYPVSLHKTLIPSE